MVGHANGRLAPATTAWAKVLNAAGKLPADSYVQQPARESRRSRRLARRIA